MKARRRKTTRVKRRKVPTAARRRSARTLVECRRELKEALEQQAATSEVLQVISSSAGDLKPVFQAMLANAVRICKANFGNLFLYEGSSFRIAVQHNPPPAYAERWRQNPVLVVDAAFVRYSGLTHLQKWSAHRSTADDVDLCGGQGGIVVYPTGCKMSGIAAD